MSRELNLEVKRGCTLKSGEIFSINETLPVNITYEQLMAGITAGTYTLKSLVGKTFKGQARERADSTIKAELAFVVSGNKMSFNIPASVTETWPNKPTTLFYDVFEITSSTGEVVEVVHGKIAVNAAITKEI